MEHRAVGICPGFDEVEHEGLGESCGQREPVSQRHWLEHEPVFVDQAEPAERLREGGTSPRDQVFPGSRLRALISSARPPLGDR
jgi:hypothetical protein